ncbi:hypothetical protein Tco_0959779, partial [Tanacetum coccineum]
LFLGVSSFLLKEMGLRLGALTDSTIGLGDMIFELGLAQQEVGRRSFGAAIPLLVEASYPLWTSYHDSIEVEVVGGIVDP